VDVSVVIRQRLKELGLEQRDLAVAAQVTESYISQLLTRKKTPPATNRTDIYEKMDAFLKLPKGQLSAMAEDQRREDLKKILNEPPSPLHGEVREVVIRKCYAKHRKQVRDIFEKQAFGELERMVTQKLLDVTKRIAREELEKESWLRSVASMRKQSYEEARSVILDFLDTDVFNISAEQCAAFLMPLIESWDIDLANFSIDVFLDRQFSTVRQVNVQFVELDDADEVEHGFTDFLNAPALRGDATGEELEFLRNLRFKRRRPTAVYYYRELQNLRDPLHFVESLGGSPQKRGDANSSEKRRQLNSRKKAVRRWATNRPGLKKGNK
jgi:transcriptional regulator with XRE-family HTH domain